MTDRSRIAIGSIAWLAVLSGLSVLDLSTYQQPAQHQPSKGPEADVDPRSADDRIADYTLWLERLTGILAVSTLGLWYVTWLTLSHAKDDAARQAADAEVSNAAALKAANAAELSAKAAIGVELPILHPILIELTIDVPPELPPETSDAERRYIWDTWRQVVGAKVSLKNYGRSPAFVSSCVINLRIRQTLPREPVYEILDLSPKPRVIDGGQHQEFIERSAATLTPITDDEIAALQAGDAWVFVYGVAEFTDVWGTPHKCGFWACRPSANSGFVTLQGAYEKYRYQS
jgi:hypothetical protein